MRGDGFVSIYSNETFHMIDINGSDFSHALGKGLNCPSPLSILCSQYIRKGKIHSSVFEDLIAMHWSSLLQKHVAPCKAEEKEEKQSVQKQRIIEDPELEGTHKEHRGPAPGSEYHESHHVPENVVQTLLEFCQAGAVTTAMGSLLSGNTFIAVAHCSSSCRLRFGVGVLGKRP